LYKLKKDFREKINDIIQISETKDTLVILIQRIKSTIFSRFEILNKIFKKKLFFEFCNFRKNFYNRKQEKTVSTNKIRNTSATASHQKNTNKFFFCYSKKVNEIARDKYIYYNCEKKNISREIVLNLLKKHK